MSLKCRCAYAEICCAYAEKIHKNTYMGKNRLFCCSVVNNLPFDVWYYLILLIKKILMVF